MYRVTEETEHGFNMLVKYILMLNAAARSASGNGEWIMTSGLWSDEGYWNDDEVWVD